MKNIRITIDGKKLLVPAGTTAGEILKRNPTGSRPPLLGAVIDNRLVDPDFTLLRNCSLRVDGLDPVALSMDDYFKDREKTPRNEQGEYDFESLVSLDLKLFNRQLRQLIDGRLVRTPIFDFKKGCRKKTAFRRTPISCSTPPWFTSRPS